MHLLSLIIFNTPHTVTKGSESDHCIVFFNMHIDSPVGEITIYSCKIITSRKGDFISFPSRKGEDDKYYAYVLFTIDDDLKEKIIDAISDNI